MRTVAEVKPELYRRMHVHALEHFGEAAAYYHVTTEIHKITPLEQVPDDRLPSYMNDDNTRQMFHITFGILLQARDNHGHLLFKDEFFKLLKDYERSLIRHIRKTSRFTRDIKGDSPHNCTGGSFYYNGERSWHERQ